MGSMRPISKRPTSKARPTLFLHSPATCPRSKIQRRYGRRCAVSGEDQAVPRLRLRFVGNVDPVVLTSIQRAGWADRLETIPYVPHDEAIRYMKRASLLLLCINRVAGAEGIVTGKLYEYLASGRPVLGVGPAGGDAAAILSETSAGQLFGHDDAEGVTAFLQRHYAAWERDEPVAGATETAAARYSRKRQTGRLAELLDRLTGLRAAAAEVADARPNR